MIVTTTEFHVGGRDCIDVESNKYDLHVIDIVIVCMISRVREELMLDRFLSCGSVL